MNYEITYSIITNNMLKIYFTGSPKYKLQDFLFDLQKIGAKDIQAKPIEKKDMSDEIETFYIQE